MMCDLRAAYPMMVPHVGTKFEIGGTRSLLLVGESHYLPDYSTQHLDPISWYSGSYLTLNDEERSWIATAQILATHRGNGFKSKAHSIYRLALKEINEHGFGYDDLTMALDHVAFLNFFQRPALKGKSLRVHPQDIEVANAHLAEVIGRLKPGMVIFLSKLGFRNCSYRPDSLRIEAVPHPGCLHWNRKARAYGGKNGREVLAELARGLWHEHSRPPEARSECP